jgi:hypothetical protein
VTAALHQVAHGLVAVGLYQAGRARRSTHRAAWLALAGVAVWRAHCHHHAIKERT